MGMGRQSSYLAAREGMVALDAEQARPAPGRRPGRSALASALVQARAQIAKITG